MPGHNAPLPALKAKANAPAAKLRKGSACTVGVHAYTRSGLLSPQQLIRLSGYDATRPTGLSAPIVSVL